MTGHEGHLFVVHGRIESVIHDAALIPVDAAYRWNPIWRDLVGHNPPLPLDWKQRGFGRIKPAPDRVWAVSIGDGAEDYEVILDRIEGALGRVHTFRQKHEPKRGEGTLPLVALPVIGIGRGGHSEDRGRVLRLLVERLTRAAQAYNLDIVLVAPEPAVFAAAQYARREITPRLPGRLEGLAKQLGTAAREGQLALLLGAGVSAAAGLPSWHGLLEALEDELGITYPQGKEPNEIDRAELIERRDKKRFQGQVAAMVRDVRWSSLLHGLLAGLDCHEVVTTNYDLLYEHAVRATDRAITGVMPWSSAHGAERWILKLHGDIDHVDQIVLTRRHMVRYDAANRPSAAVLQSLLLTKHLLAVGVSMTDDNVIRLAHEVQAYREEHQKGQRHDAIGTVLDTAGDQVRAELWDGQLDWVMLEQQSGMPGRRTQELLLDRVAAHAARDSSWLLDERFEGLLQSDDDRRLAGEIRRLYRQIPNRDGNKWTPLVRRLEELGVQGGGQRRFR